MKNYISVNTKYFKSNQISKIANHNSRISDIDYLLNEEHQKYKNTNFVFGDGGSVVLDEDSKLGGIGTYSHNLKLMRATQSNSIKKSFYSLQEKKINALQKSYKYKPNENENEIVEMVVSLSEEQALNYLEKGFSFDEAIKDYMLQIKLIYGFEPISFQGHIGDEGWIDRKNIVHRNVHFHCQFLNFDFTKNKSVLRNLRKKDWENMQDIAQNSFQKYDFNFIRGEPKSETGKEHLERIEYVAQQKLKEIKELFDTLNKEKNSLKTIRENFERDSNKYKILSTSIKNLQQKEKLAREQYSNLDNLIKNKKSEVEIIEIKIEDQNKWLEDTRKDLKQFILEHTQKNSSNKYEVKNMKEFYNEIVDLALYLSNYDLSLKGFEEVKAINLILKNKIEQIKEISKKDKQDISSLNNKIDSLVYQKDSLEYENYLYKKFLENQNKEDDYNRFCEELQQEQKYDLEM